MHDVGTQTYTDVESVFDTPQVANVFDGAPYLHDGRCYSLEEIWTVYNPDDLHGVTNEMDKRMLNELIEYIKTLSEREPMSGKEFMTTFFPPPRKGGVPLAVEGVTKPVEPPAKYVGNKVCANCHLSQYKTWLGTKHARTFVFLGSQNALKIIKAAEVRPPHHNTAVSASIAMGRRRMWTLPFKLPTSGLRREFPASTATVPEKNTAKKT